MKWILPRSESPEVLITTTIHLTKTTNPIKEVLSETVTLERTTAPKLPLLLNPPIRHIPVRNSGRTPRTHQEAQRRLRRNSHHRSMITEPTRQACCKRAGSRLKIHGEKSKNLR